MKKTLALLLALVMALGIMMPSAAFAASTKLTVTIKIVDDNDANKKVERTTSNLISESTSLLYEIVKILEDDGGYEDLETVFAGTELRSTVDYGLQAFHTGVASWASYCDSYGSVVSIVKSSTTFSEKARTADAYTLTVGDLKNDYNNVTELHYVSGGQAYTVTMTLTETSSGTGGGATGGGGGGGGTTPVTPDEPDTPSTPGNNTIKGTEPIQGDDYTVTPVVEEGKTEATEAKIELKSDAVSKAKGNGKGDKVLVAIPVNGDGNIVMEDLPDTTVDDPIEYAVVKNGYAYVLVDRDSEIYIETRVDLFPDTFNHWSKSDVDFTAGREIFKGVSTTERIFAPDDTLTRGMLVTVLYRMENASAEGIANKFSDVEEGAWYTDAINWAAEEGIVLGVGEGKFAPDQNINREEIATMMYRYAQKCGYILTGEDSITFTDAAEISGWAEAAVQALVKAGVLNGKETGAYDPAAGATRGESSAILARFIKNVVG